MVGLKKIDLKVEMCCMKCAEIVSEEIREVPGELSSTNVPEGPAVLQMIDRRQQYLSKVGRSEVSMQSSSYISYCHSCLIGLVTSCC